MYRIFSGHAVAGDVGELNSGTVYMFWVVARIQEADGSIIDSPPSIVTLDSTVFVPGMYIVPQSELYCFVSMRLHYM